MTLVLIVIFTGFFYSVFLFRIITGLKYIVYPNIKADEELPKVSLIIPFRNEAENLPSLLNSVSNLNYPEDKLDIIFVDDNSDDEGSKIIRDFGGSNIRIIECGGAGKKRAIQTAVETADSEIFAITDADCRHNSVWLRTLISAFEEDTGFVAAPALFNSSGSFFDELQRIEFAGIVIASAGLIGIGQPFTCSAANIAFRKKAFEDAEGYKGNEGILSGDDEFLMQKIAYSTDWSVKYAAGNALTVFTKANAGVGDFINQRSRWASKGFAYSNSIITVQLLMIFIFFLSVLLLPFSGSEGVFLFFAAALIWKAAWEGAVLLKGKKNIFRKLSLKYFIFAEVFHIPYIVLSAMLGTLGVYKWKRRSPQ